MKSYFLLILFLLGVWSCAAQKSRLLVTTDIGGDPDDQQSLIRLMVYANEFDLEGIIASSSGTPGELKEALVRPDLVEEIIRGYQAVYVNLLKHDKNFQSPEEMLSVVKKGNPHRGWENVGEGKDTEGSEWIIKQVDKEDKRPLNICIFGGQTDLAQALWKVKATRNTKEYNRFLSRIRVYEINDQDKVFKQLYGEHKVPFYIQSKAPEGVDKREGAYRGIYLGGDESLTSLAWLKENILENNGPLGKLYPIKTWTAPNPYGAMKEGDTPSWFFFLENGLNVPGHPVLGGWGGRFRKTRDGFYADTADSFQNEVNARATVYRWRADFQNDWAARMDWCVGDYSECNHAPVVSVNGVSSNEPLIISEKPGTQIRLDASGCKDPDNDILQLEWMVYPEADKLKGALQINADGSKISLLMPELEPEARISLVLKVTDSGIPALTGYKRIILLSKSR